jgi:hypothetical protein
MREYIVTSKASSSRKPVAYFTYFHADGRLLLIFFPYIMFYPASTALLG